MKSVPLDKAVKSYLESLEKVLEKRKLWNESTRPLLLETLKGIEERFSLGWKVQELNWLWNNKAVNLMFDSVPKELADRVDYLHDFEFIRGTALVFSQKYNGDISVMILYPEVSAAGSENEFKELGSFHPKEIEAAFIEEKVSAFLEEIMVWEDNAFQHRVGFSSR